RSLGKHHRSQLAGFGGQYRVRDLKATPKATAGEIGDSCFSRSRALPGAATDRVLSTAGFPKNKKHGRIKGSLPCFFRLFPLFSFFASQRGLRFAITAGAPGDPWPPCSWGRVPGPFRTPSSPPGTAAADSKPCPN